MHCKHNLAAKLTALAVAAAALPAASTPADATTTEPNQARIFVFIDVSSRSLSSGGGPWAGLHRRGRDG